MEMAARAAGRGSRSSNMRKRKAGGGGGGSKGTLGGTMGCKKRARGGRATLKDRK